MEDVQRLIDILDEYEYLVDANGINYIHMLYEEYKEKLSSKFQNEDEYTFFSYLKAYFIYEYLKKDDRQKELFIVTLEKGIGYKSTFKEFIEKINAIDATPFELTDKEVLDRLAELRIQSNESIYRELSKSNKEIAKIIKKNYNYYTIDEIKEGKSLRIGNKEYKLSNEEIEIIDGVKKNFQLNQFAHMVYDEKGYFCYECDSEIHNDDEVLKRFLVNTNRNNPEIKIIYSDGKIVDYYNGYIRLKPYNFKDIVEYTKLYYTENYEELKRFQQDRFKTKTMSYKVGKSMICLSFEKAISILDGLEDIYTKKTIEEAKEEFTKLKKIVKEYDL